MARIALRIAVVAAMALTAGCYYYPYGYAYPSPYGYAYPVYRAPVVVYPAYRY